MTADLCERENRVMDKSFVCELDYPVVETDRGRVRGYYMNGLFYFRGIPYAKADRFMLPRPADGWEGIRPAYTYGPNPPTTNPPQINRADQAFQFRYWPEGEDCQTLNIWTASIGSGVKKPVIVWIHGGALAFGSATELMGYEADGICRDGDVVVVSVNHRLNLLGYMNLTAYGDRYAHSGTAGMMDLVAALGWVRRNIGNFGGDADNVTVFGHSGGGAKVRTLMQMPEADGLFQKAMIHSGLRFEDDRFRPMEIVRRDSAATAAAIVDCLGIAGDIRQIEKLPYRQLAQAFIRVNPQLVQQGVNSVWSPVPDCHFPGDALEIGLSERAGRTPMIIGTTFGEMDLDRGVVYDSGLKGEALREKLNEYYGEGGELLQEGFRRAFGWKRDVDLLYLDSVYRLGSCEYMDLRAARGAAPTYSYMLTYDFKLFGGFPAWHGSDLPLIFKSGSRVPVYNEPGAQRLEQQLSAAVVAYAHTGKPHTDQLPAWGPYSREHPRTMILDETCFVWEEIDREFMLEHYRRAPGFTPPAAVVGGGED